MSGEQVAKILAEYDALSNERVEVAALYAAAESADDDGKSYSRADEMRFDLAIAEGNILETLVRVLRAPQRAPWPQQTYDGEPWCPKCGDGRLALIEGGYEREWRLRWEEMDDAPGQVVLFAEDDGLESYGDDGDGDYFARCTSCLATFEAPGDGPLDECDGEGGGWVWA